MKGVLVGARLAVFAQQWQNLLGECRSWRILRSGILLKWECHQPPLTRTPIPTRNKKQDLQKAVDSMLEKGDIEPVHSSHFPGFFSRLFLVPKKTGDLCPVIDLSTLNRHLVFRCLRKWPRQSGLQSVRTNGRHLLTWCMPYEKIYHFIIPLFFLFFSKLYPIKSCILPNFFL